MSFRLPASFSSILILASSAFSGGCFISVEMAEGTTPHDTSVLDAGLSGSDTGLPNDDAGLTDGAADADDMSSDAAVLPDASSDAAVLPDISPNVAPDAATLESLEPLVREVVGPLVGADDPDLAIGAVVALVTPRGTQVVGLGTRERGGATVDAETTFQIGSVTKVFTGLLLATLAERPGGPVAAEDPVNDHLIDVVTPEFEGQAITLEHLATHYSALDNMPTNMTGPRLSPARDYSRDMLTTYLAQAHLERAPGASYAYSNLGCGLLGVALADAAGHTDYDSLLAAELVGPLGLSRTGTNTSAMWAIAADNVARGHNLANGVQTAVDYADMGVLAGGGEAVSTGGDMAMFVEVMTGLRPYPVAGAVERAVANRGPGEGNLQIGYGWNIASGDTTYEKGGLTAGFTAFVVFKRAPQIGVVILSNRSAHRDIVDAARTLADRLAALE